MESANTNLIVVGVILLFFALWGEYKATTQVSKASKKFTVDTLPSDDPSTLAHQQCNNYLYTEEFIQKVKEIATIQWRRAMIIAFFSLIIAIPFGGDKYFGGMWTPRKIVIHLFIIFVTVWLVQGYSDYHLRSVADTSIEAGLESTALTFEGGQECTYSIHPSYN